MISFFQQLPKEFNLEKYVDYQRQFEKSFFDHAEKCARIYWMAVRKTWQLDEFLLRYYEFS